jgi:hypothetical protein
MRMHEACRTAASGIGSAKTYMLWPDHIDVTLAKCFKKQLQKQQQPMLSTAHA